MSLGHSDRKTENAELCITNSLTQCFIPTKIQGVLTYKKLARACFYQKSHLARTLAKMNPSSGLLDGRRSCSCEIAYQ